MGSAQLKTLFLYLVAALLQLFLLFSSEGSLTAARALEQHAAHRDLAVTSPETARRRSCLHGRSSCRHGKSSVSLDKRRSNVYFVSETKSGGSKKYLDDLITHFSVYGIKFTFLPNKAAVAATKFRENDILLFQYIMYTDFSFRDVQDIVRKYKLRLVIPIHDKYMLNDDPEADLVYKPLASHELEPEKIPRDKLELLQMAEQIIFPSHFIYNVYAAYVQLKSMIVVPHIDHRLNRFLYVPPIDNAINLAVITEMSITKGSDILERLFLENKAHGSAAVNFHIYAPYTNADHLENVFEGAKYTEAEVYKRLVDDNIHGLLFINNYPETYSYALTKGINSGLPILYTRIGAAAERLGEELDGEKYFATDNKDVAKKLNDMLDFIVKHAGKGSRPRVQSTMTQIPAFYDGLFFEGAAPIMRRVQKNYDRFADDFTRAHEKIEPYAIYFPQFHAIPENDVNFYPGFTDMVNLVQVRFLRSKTEKGERKIRRRGGGVAGTERKNQRERPRW